MTFTISPILAEMIAGRTLYVCTKHRKERIIRSVLNTNLPIKETLALDVDTDRLGTFSGEVERKHDPMTTLRMKVQLAPPEADLIVATEGSFGPHPAFFMLPAHEEIILFYDKLNQLEVVEREITSQTNFQGKEISSSTELQTFLDQAGFPSHGVIMMRDRESLLDLHKGIQDIDTAHRLFEQLMQNHGKCYVETDMRAHMNPNRMVVIEKLANKLVDRLNTLCPDCQTPGFGLQSANRGLPCEICGMPTNAILSYTYACVKCNFTDEVKYPKGQRFSDAMHCDYCNP